MPPIMGNPITAVLLFRSVGLSLGFAGRFHLLTLLLRIALSYLFLVLFQFLIHSSCVRRRLSPCDQRERCKNKGNGKHHGGYIAQLGRVIPVEECPCAQYKNIYENIVDLRFDYKFRLAHLPVPWVNQGRQRTQRRHQGYLPEQLCLHRLSWVDHHGKHPHRKYHTCHDHRKYSH